jgi:hypothetical protein
MNISQMLMRSVTPLSEAEMTNDKLFDGSNAHLLTHLVPTNDLREHATDGDCWCNPTLDQEHLIIIHNSMDEHETTMTNDYDKEYERIIDRSNAQQEEIESLRQNLAEAQEGCRIKDEQIETLEQTLAEVKIVSDHNLNVYHEAASKLRQQLAEALAACKVKDELMVPLREYGNIRKAIAIQPDDSALRAWLGDPLAYLKTWKSVGDGGMDRCKVELSKECEPWLDVMFPRVTPLYARKK